ncbi:hypothetical protein AAC387_Pa05g0940 [Persea americana]
MSQTPIIWCGNVGAISLASNPIFHARTKHMEVDYHYIREKVLRKELIVHLISTVDQLVDIFTKGLTSARFSLLKDKLMVRSPPISLRGDISTTDDQLLDPSHGPITKDKAVDSFQYSRSQSL